MQTLFPGYKYPITTNIFQIRKLEFPFRLLREKLEIHPIVVNIKNMNDEKGNNNDDNNDNKSNYNNRNNQNNESRVYEQQCD